jgi:hypothetical protein
VLRGAVLCGLSFPSPSARRGLACSACAAAAILLPSFLACASLGGREGHRTALRSLPKQTANQPAVQPHSERKHPTPRHPTTRARSGSINRSNPPKQRSQWRHGTQGGVERLRGRGIQVRAPSFSEVSQSSPPPPAPDLMVCDARGPGHGASPLRRRAAPRAAAALSSPARRLARCASCASQQAPCARRCGRQRPPPADAMAAALWPQARPSFVARAASEVADASPVSARRHTAQGRDRSAGAGSSPAAQLTRSLDGSGGRRGCPA